ncbi:Lsr2 family DNA-binding protein [Amycolatopsis vastitatis]|uniref:Lsr2 family DNA-binding protein n=1 Tax=Amycolatopsis vastitatis TaxID=1905142 RepID=UPI00130418E1|nr:histone-like nucleoid-structuring protein Lsr2 [Amycolatopsis vastitatis]
MVVDDEEWVSDRTVTEGRRATLYQVDLDADGGERDVHRVLSVHRRTCTSEEVRRQSHPLGEEDDAATVREWARLRGLPVSARGRISSEIRRQYDEDRAVSGTVADAVNRAAVENGDGENVVEITQHRGSAARGRRR